MYVRAYGSVCVRLHILCVHVMCACMHTYMYAYMHAAYMHACMYVFMCECMHACVYVCIYVCVYVCMHICIYVCMYACMHAFMKFSYAHVLVFVHKHSNIQYPYRTNKKTIQQNNTKSYMMHNFMTREDQGEAELSYF
jgi:hypothetical protein